MIVHTDGPQDSLCCHCIWCLERATYGECESDDDQFNVPLHRTIFCYTVQVVGHVN